MTKYDLMLQRIDNQLSIAIATGMQEDMALYLAMLDYFNIISSKQATRNLMD